MTKKEALIEAQKFIKNATVSTAERPGDKKEYRVGKISGMEIGFPMNFIQGIGYSWEEALEKAKENIK